jgi:hypothetical protein
MQNSLLSHPRKFVAWLTLALSLVFLTGCETLTLTNLTPGSLPENPSRIYTITMRVTPARNAAPTPQNITPFIIIDGKNYQMVKSKLGENIFEYDYQLPASRTEMAYYFIVKYQVEVSGRLEPRETYSELTRASTVNRYVLSLEVNRGPVGARISVLGRGFSPQDVIYFDNVPTRTVYESPNSLSFYVPALEAGRNYQIMLGSASGNSPVGTFRIDASSLSVIPSALTLRPGETQVLTFTVANPAPAGGLLLDVTTDVPECIIMPEAVVPAGQTTLTINVQGGKPGSGSLFLKGYGAGEVTIPVTVTEK